jgi:phospho-N-acetylmuramoyl-pentapeptide-transferase
MLYFLLEQSREWLIEAGLYRFVMILDQLTFRALAAAMLSFATVLALGRPVIGWLRRKKIGDSGLSDAAALSRAAASKANTPTMGGILIVGAIAGSTLLLADIKNFYVQLGLVTLLWLAVLGGFDDWLKLTSKSRAAAGAAGARQGLRAWEKLVFQLGLGLMIGYFTFGKGDSSAPLDLAHVLNLPFQKTYQDSEGLSTGLTYNSSLVYMARTAFIVVTVLMIAGMSNAVNITDGMDGLASGVTVSVAMGLVVLTYIAGSEATAQFLRVPFVTESNELIVLAAATAGACLGFLWWNCAPAQVFMGDTGSLALGGVIAYIAVVIRQEAVVLLMCGVFLLEIASVTLQVGCFKVTRRLTGTGKRIFKIAPYHHNLHLAGWTEGQVVTRAWIVSGILVVVALALVKVR